MVTFFLHVLHTMWPAEQEGIGSSLGMEKQTGHSRSSARMSDAEAMVAWGHLSSQDRFLKR